MPGFGKFCCFFFFCKRLDIKDLGHFETHKNSVPYSLLLVFILFDFIQTFKCMGGYMSLLKIHTHYYKIIISTIYVYISDEAYLKSNIFGILLCASHCSAHYSCNPRLCDWFSPDIRHRFEEDTPTLGLCICAPVSDIYIN